MRGAISSLGLVALGFVVACGGDATSARTAAEAAVVRGRVEVGGEPISVETRLEPGSIVRSLADGRSRLRFDDGTRVLLDADSELEVREGGEARFVRGRAFFDAPAGEPFVLATAHGELRFADAQVAVESAGETVVAHVLRGGVAHREGNHRGVVSSGRKLVLSSAEPRSEPEVLWNDFTGGLASPGPRDPREAAGVGVLEGRRPGDLGDARWPLVVRTLDVKVRIVGDLAITDVEQIFFNPASTTLEGLYRVRVPEGSVLHRFAVDRDGRMVDGYVREKRDAAAAYQAQVFEGSTLDPALLEWDAPLAYRARIHPIRAGESRRIAVRYSTWLGRPSPDAARVYRFPMDGGPSAPEVEALSIDVDLAGTSFGALRASHGARLSGQRVELRRSDIRPRADFVLELEDEEREGARAYRAEHHEPLRDPNALVRTETESDYFFVPLVVEPPVRGRADAPLDLVVVADLSAGTDRSQLELGRTAIEALAAQLREGDRLAIVGGDLALRPLADGGALGAAGTARLRSQLEALARAPAGGASDLGAMITEAAARLDPTRNGAVVYVGDGAPTVGELGAGPLLERLSRLPNPLRAFAVAIGNAANTELLAAVTRGSGRVERVTTRSEAADAALAIVAHAMRPVLSRVEIDLGTGIDRVYPRGPVDVVEGEALAIVGRVRGTVPSSVKVTGYARGSRFERRIPLEVESLEDAGDLRLRWAGARLDRLLLDGARRAEIVDLGVRSGVITPFTSLYVPSAAELANLGPSARDLVRDDALARAPRVRADGALGRALGYALSPLASLYGCSNSEAPPPPAQGSASDLQANEAMAPGEPMAPPPAIGPMAPPPAMAPAPQPAPMARARRAAPEAESMARADTAAASARPSADDARGGEAMERSENLPSPGPTDMLAPADGEPGNSAGRLGLMGSGVGGGGEGTTRTGNGFGSTGTRGLGANGSATSSEGRAARPAASAATTTVQGAHRAAQAAAQAIVAIDSTVTISVDHQTRHCSDASGMLLEARAGLWRERLARAYAPDEWARIYQRAVSSCEATTSRDRRRLLDLVLDRAGDVSTMVTAYQGFTSTGARSYLRRAIFVRVHTPDDLRIVRAAFGTQTVDQTLVEAELAGATDDAARARVLRRLVSRFGFDLELAMRLLGIHERMGKRDEATQLALELRQNPLTDAGMRTAIGEMFLRFGDEAEARRSFSEIVEFAPRDELARRRLGDLYRAHGWFEDAYRQYQTLANLRPDDSTVLLLLAQAAAGAGRIDEALRLEQRLAETAEPGGAEGPARIAILWSSVRLAELRAAARAAGDQTKLRSYLGAMRRGGVLGEAGALRATLVWEHPDADLSLYAAHPGLGLSRPTDLSPELGLEAFDVQEREAGTYRLEVRRGARDTLTTVRAKLVVVLREGAADERIVVVPLEFRAGASARGFVVEGDEVRPLASEGGAR